MRILSPLRTRDPVVAARSAGLILFVCALVLAGYTVFQDMSAGPLIQAVSWTVVAAVAAASAACRLAPAALLDRWGFYTLVALAGIGLLCALNLLTHDASAAAQAFLAFPVLWAASHLRPPAVVGVTAAAALSDAATLFPLLPLDVAATDLVFFGAVLVVMASMLVRAGRVQDRLVAALQEQATVDSLTGLVNRRVFDGALEDALTRQVPGGTALVLIDVDAFKSINDSHGHPVGDDVLVHLAGLLRAHVRADDAVLSRLGGDELAVLLPGTPADAAARRAEDLLHIVRSTPFVLDDGTALALSISVGVAHATGWAEGLRALYAQADAALYEAKRAGRGRVAVASA